MKRRTLAILLALCITASNTMGVLATEVEQADPQIVEEFSAEESTVSFLEEAENEIVDNTEDMIEEETGENEEENVEEESDNGSGQEPDQTVEEIQETEAEASAEAQEETVTISYPSDTQESDTQEEQSGRLQIDEIAGDDITEQEDAELFGEEATIYEDGEVLETLKAAQNHIEEDIIQSTDGQSGYNAVKAVNTEENINKLIDYIMTNCMTIESLRIGELDEGSFIVGDYTIHPFIVVNLSTERIRFQLQISPSKSTGVKGYIYLDYKIDKKQFEQVYSECTINGKKYESNAEIDIATHMPRQKLEFVYAGQDSISNTTKNTINEYSTIFKDIAFTGWEMLLHDKLHMSLCSIGFFKYLLANSVKCELPSTSFVHTGKEIKPSVKVTYQDYTTLEEGVQYELEYENNIDVGYATVKINAYDDLFESESFDFTILPAASKKVTIYNVAQGIKVTWLGVEGATRYYVYRDGKLIKTTSVLEITDGDVKYRSGEKFTYKVVATAKNVGDSTAARTGTYYRLMPVGIKSLTNSAAGKMTVTYDKSKGSSGYVVRYGQKSDMSDAKVITVKGENTLSRTFSGLIKGKTYYVQVRTYKIDNGIRYYSGYCTTKLITIKK